MGIITIPKKIIQDDDLVVIPRREYEALLKFRKVKEFIPTPAQRRALRAAEDNLRQRKTLGYNELVHKLGFTN